VADPSTALAGALPLALAALALLLAVAGSVVPGVPSGLLSLLGVLGYWWWSGFAEPGTAVALALLALAALTVVVDLLAGPLAAKAGGASRRSVALAAVVALPAALVTGPVGLLVGVAGTVFVVEFYGSRRGDASARAAAYATVGVLGSGLLQAVLTATVLVAFLLAVLL
jgi:uncharacterized protein YqgC (DUF456 family)